MPKSIQPIIEELFAAEKSGGRRLNFSWRLIRRRHRPFLLLPDKSDMRVSLELYSAQRRRAKIWRALLPLALHSPGVSLFTKISLQPETGSQLLRFLSEQSGVSLERFQAPAIKFGGLELHKSRLVLLLCDETRRPVKVVKLGLNAVGRAATEREADLLEKLPADKIGCIRMTGRLGTAKISAFATAYYPGESPEDDAGMENLFHSWINPGRPAPIDELDSWSELDAAAPDAWPALRPLLAGKTIRTTLYHGDFAPWNIRAINAQNLQAFDWERGNLHGIPGWDWFHFIVQTSTLARRHSVERVAAEVEQLFQSPRFEKYAALAGISDLVKPLMLAYLLHHRWVVRPLEGGHTTAQLHELLSARWRLQTGPKNSSLEKVPSRPAGLLVDGGHQLQAAWSQLANVFWEPKLNASVQPAWRTQLLAHWPLALLGCLWLATVAAVQFYFVTNQVLLPVYAIPCLLVAWKMGRRWGTLFAVVTGVIAPMVTAAKDPTFHADLVCWNAVMRFITLQMCVFFTDRIHRQKDFFQCLTAPNRRAANFSENWAVILISGLLFLIVAAGDYYTGPRMLFLPIYLIPAMLITLFLNLRWGIVVVLLAALAASTDEYLKRFNSSVAQVFGWNLSMRFSISFLVILLLDRLRQENVLFPPRKQNGGLRESES
jgi:hypothetical protein